MKELSIIFAIIGTVIGSGFISGKEVAVFFARFGFWSIPCIFIAFFLFWLLFYSILIKGDKILFKLKKSKLFMILNIILCIIFTSAMFAGINNFLIFDNFFINFLIFSCILALCTLIFKKGTTFLNKLNFILIPVMLVIFLALLSSKSSLNFQLQENSHSIWSPFYCVFYVVLNTSNSCVMLASLGEGLSRKQKARASFYSSLVLMLILLFVNIILLQHSSLISLDMPLLSLFNGWERTLLNIIIFIGCSTTLFSLIFSSSLTIRGLCNNEFLVFIISIVVPTILSLVGFGFIITYLYPLASIVGIFLLLNLLFEENIKVLIKGGKKF